MATVLDEPQTGRFRSPFGIETTPGAAGWREMYPPYLLFSEENRAFEDSVFWIWDSMHLPEVELPFDTHTHENWIRRSRCPTRACLRCRPRTGAHSACS